MSHIVTVHCCHCQLSTVNCQLGHPVHWVWFCFGSTGTSFGSTDPAGSRSTGSGSTSQSVFNKQEFKVSVMENVNPILEDSAKQCELLSNFFYKNKDECEPSIKRVDDGITQFKNELEMLLDNLDKEGILISDEYNRTLAAFICIKILDDMKDGDGDFDTDDLKKLIEGHIKNLIISLYIGFTLEEYNLLYDISGKDYIPPDDIPPDDIPPNKDEKYFNKVSVNSSYKGLIPRSYILSTYYTILF